jgi:glycosyltransferase involved in cell wall biosynthesis
VKQKGVKRVSSFRGTVHYQDRPAVSIIIPVYNTVHYLQKTLDSLLNQTIRNLEIICVDNGSTDGSQSILRDYEKRDSRIRILDWPIGRTGGARNAGIEAARGEFIGFVDSDDFVEADFYEKLIRSARQFQCDMSVGDLLLYSERTSMKKMYRITEIVRNLANNTTRILHDANEKLSLIHANSNCNKVFRTDLIRKYGIRFPENVLFEDNPFHVQTLWYAKRISVQADTAYYYVQRKRQTSNTAQALQAKSAFNIFTVGQDIQSFLQAVGAFEPGNPWRSAFIKYMLVDHNLPLFIGQDFSNRPAFFSEYKKILHNFSDQEIQRSVSEKEAKLLLRIKHEPYTKTLYSMAAQTHRRLFNQVLRYSRLILSYTPGLIWILRRLNRTKL